MHLPIASPKFTCSFGCHMKQALTVPFMLMSFAALSALHHTHTHTHIHTHTSPLPTLAPCNCWRCSAEAKATTAQLRAAHQRSVVVTESARICACVCMCVCVCVCVCDSAPQTLPPLPLLHPHQPPPDRTKYSTEMRVQSLLLDEFVRGGFDKVNRLERRNAASCSLLVPVCVVWLRAGLPVSLSLYLSISVLSVLSACLSVSVCLFISLMSNTPLLHRLFSTPHWRSRTHSVSTCASTTNGSLQTPFAMCRTNTPLWGSHATSCR